MVNNIEQKDFGPLTAREYWLAHQIIDIALCIHKAFGPGLMESVYEKGFCYELGKRNIFFERQRLSACNMMDW